MRDKTNAKPRDWMLLVLGGGYCVLDALVAMEVIRREWESSAGRLGMMAVLACILAVAAVIAKTSRVERVFSWPAVTLFVLVMVGAMCLNAAMLAGSA